MYKPLLAAGRSEDNAQGWKIVRNVNSWPRSEASRATVKFWASQKGVYLFYNPLNNFSKRTQVDPSYIFCGLSLRSITILRFVSRDQFYPMRARRNYSVGYQCIHNFFFRMHCCRNQTMNICRSSELINWFIKSICICIITSANTLISTFAEYLILFWRDAKFFRFGEIRRIL